MKLTKREIDVLRTLRTHETCKSAATTLGISKRTVDFHLANIYNKTGLRSLHLVLLSPQVAGAI